MVICFGNLWAGQGVCYLTVLQVQMHMSERVHLLVAGQCTAVPLKCNLPLAQLSMSRFSTLIYSYVHVLARQKGKRCVWAPFDLLPCCTAWGPSSLCLQGPLVGIMAPIVEASVGIGDVATNGCQWDQHKW